MKNISSKIEMHVKSDTYNVKIGSAISSKFITIDWPPKIFYVNFDISHLIVDKISL